MIFLARLQANASEASEETIAVHPPVAEQRSHAQDGNERPRGKPRGIGFCSSPSFRA